MNPDNDRKYVRVKKITIVIVVLILAAGVFGWWLGRSDDSSSQQTNPPPVDTTVQPITDTSASDASVKSLVSYRLPDGWREATCPSAPGVSYILPDGGSNVDCSANPSAPVKISVDPANNKDCNQLQSVQNVSKHVCVSEFINGRKSLKAETVYNKNSAYKKAVGIHAYYIDTGKGVVKLEYFHDPNDNGDQAGFDELAKSVQVKG